MCCRFVRLFGLCHAFNSGGFVCGMLGDSDQCARVVFLFGCRIVEVMTWFECTVQEGCIDERFRPGFESALETICVDILGPEAGPVEVSWVVIKRGFGFRAGEPSTTSLVRGRIPDGCDGQTRAQLLRAIGDAWCRLTGAREHELVVSARDQSWAG